MPPFIYFFLAVYFFSSLIAYSIKSYDIFWVEGVSWSSLKSTLGDLAVRSFLIFVIWYGVSNLVGDW